MNLIHKWAKAIVEANVALALRPDALRALHFLRLGDTVPLSDGPSDASRLHDAALLACHALDFGDADAQRVASAWRAQYIREGKFDPAKWPEQAQDFGLQAWPRPQAGLPCPQHMGLYAVLPDAAWVKRMAKAGAPAIQMRFTSDDMYAIRDEVFAAVEAVRGTHTLLFINNHWKAAIEAGAYGVHLGREDLNRTNLDALRQAEVRVGISARSYDDIFQAHSARASYIALGPIFSTSRQRPRVISQGVKRLRRYAALLAAHPMVAFGGIRPDSAASVLGCGVGTIATMNGLIEAKNPEQQLGLYLDACQRFKPGV